MTIIKSLKTLGRVNPDSRFVEQARQRLLCRMQIHSLAVWEYKPTPQTHPLTPSLSQERGENGEMRLIAVLRRLARVMPSPIWALAARQRLLCRIADQGDAIYRVSAIWWIWLKRGVASVLVMLMVVVPTLFFVDGGQYVNASQESMLRVTAGQALIQRMGDDEWQPISDTVVLKTGDTIQLNSDSRATLSFFDDSQVRLADRATVIVNKLAPLARHGAGVIEVSLMGGRAWVQTINIPDGYKSLTVRTQDAFVGADNAVFDVSADPQGITAVRVFKHHVLMGKLDKKTGATLTQSHFGADQLTPQPLSVGKTHPQPLSIPSTLLRTSLERGESGQEVWVSENLRQDELHLAALQEREMELREKTAGVLPGHFLYPVKQIKESVMKALAFTPDSQSHVQLNIANKRLSEAIVLLNKQQYEKAQEAMMAYQSVARQIANEAQGDRSLRSRVHSELITRNYKSLVASLPTADIYIVREAIDATEEMITSDPLEREEVRLQNMTESMAQIQDYVAAGNIEAAKEVLVAYETMESSLLSEANALEDIEQRKAILSRILELRNDALLAVKTLQHSFALEDVEDGRFVALLQDVDQATQREINKVNALIQPLLPEETATRLMTPEEQKIAEFVGSVEIYRTWQGQKNQVSRLLKEMGREAKNIEFLAKLRSELTSPFARSLINVRLLELKKTARENRHKAVERKIEQTMAKRGE